MFISAFSNDPAADHGDAEPENRPRQAKSDPAPHSVDHPGTGPPSIINACELEAASSGEPKWQHLDLTVDRLTSPIAKRLDEHQRAGFS